MATCPRAQLGAYLDRELSARQVLVMERHLAGCPACRAALAELRAVQDAFGALRSSLDELIAREPAAQEANLRAVRGRIVRQAARPGWRERCGVWWAELWAFRPAWAAAVLAALVVAVAAPLAWLVARTPPGAPKTLRLLQPAMIESIEYGGQSVIIMQDPTSGNTIIWLQTAPAIQEDDGSL